MGSLLPLFLAVALLAGGRWASSRRARAALDGGPADGTPAFAAQMARRDVRAGGLVSVGDPRHRGVGGRGLLRADLRLRLAGSRCAADGGSRCSSRLARPRPAALALAPFVVFQLAAIDASVPGRRQRTAQRHLRGFQVRMFLAVVAPIAAFVVVVRGDRGIPRGCAPRSSTSGSCGPSSWSSSSGPWPTSSRAWCAGPGTPNPSRGHPRELLDDVARRSNFEPAALRSGARATSWPTRRSSG